MVEGLSARCWRHRLAGRGKVSLQGHVLASAFDRWKNVRGRVYSAVQDGEWMGVAV